MDSIRAGLVAGLAVLDLVNTVSWRGNPARSEDLLAAPADCVTWAVVAGVITEAEAGRLPSSGPSAAELRDGLTVLRELVARTVADPDGPLEPAVATTIRDAYAHADLIGSRGTRRWAVSTVDEHLVRRRLALELEWLLTTDPGRIGECGDEECRWVFLDTSRGRNRRWCRSEDCGNRHRVREHARRAAAQRP